MALLYLMALLSFCLSWGFPCFCLVESYGNVYVFITAVPITKLFACVGGETMEDMCYERLRAEACVD